MDRRKIIFEAWMVYIWVAVILGSLLPVIFVFVMCDGSEELIEQEYTLYYGEGKQLDFTSVDVKHKGNNLTYHLDNGSYIEIKENIITYDHGEGVCEYLGEGYVEIKKGD